MINIIRLFISRFTLAVVGSMVLALAVSHSALALEPDSKEQAVYEEISYKLSKLYPNAVCNHNVHVVVAIDTSGSMRDSNVLNGFYKVWDELLTHFFVLGDRFTLIPYHNDVLVSGRSGAPVLVTREYPSAKSDIGILRSWFQDSMYQQPNADHGTVLLQAEKAALETATKLVREDKDRTVLLLVVSDGCTSNPANSEQNKKETESKGAIASLSSGFVANEGQNTGETALPSLDPQQLGTGQLRILCAAESGWKSKPARSVKRMVAVPELVKTPPEPDYSFMFPAAMLCLMFGIPLAMLLKSSVTVIGPNGDVRRAVSAFRSIPVVARNDAQQTPDNEVWISLDSNQDPRPLFSISGLSPAGCKLRKSDGAVLRNASGTDVTEIVVQYGESESVAAGLLANSTVHVKVIPDYWTVGKIWPLVGIIFLVVLSIFMIVVAATHPKPEFPNGKEEIKIVRRALP